MYGCRSAASEATDSMFNLKGKLTWKELNTKLLTTTATLHWNLVFVVVVNFNF